LVSTVYKVNLYTVLSTRNEVTFSSKYLLSTSLLCSQPCRYQSRTLRCQRVLLARDSLARLGGSLCLIGEAVFQISVLSSSCWYIAISICCNDSRHCHAKDVILILHGYIGLDM